MIPAREFADQPVAVFGLGASGRSAAAALMAGGAQLQAWDDAEDARAAAAEQGIPIKDFRHDNWAQMAALIVAPGVPLTHPQPHSLVARARMADVPVIGDIELFARAAAAEQDRPKIVAITGTNGKSTTTALLGHIVAACGRDAQIGGNIGTPALDLDPFHAGAVYVLEVSSFQLELAPSLRPDVAVWLNLSPDHLDRHGDMAGYEAAKRRIFANQTPADAAVIGVDDAVSHALAAQMRSAADGPRVVPVSAQSALSTGVHAVGGMLFDAMEGRVSENADLRAAQALMGRHNWQNAAAAYAAARLIGLDPRRIVEALISFPGLAHRMELVGRAGPVRFINDSKATNTNAARQALGAFDSVFWIAGGRSKGESFTDLASLTDRVKKAYLIGETAEQIAAELGGAMAYEISRTLEAAVAHAARDAATDGSDPVVLLSPACASFDQFASFAARGDAFRQCVAALGLTQGGGGPDAGSAVP